MGAPDDGVPVEDALGSVHRNGVQLVFRFVRPSVSAFKGSPAHVSAFSGPAVWPASGRFPATTAWSSGMPSRVPLPFGRRHLLLGHPVPPRDSAPLTIGLPEPSRPGPDGFSMFRARETRPGWMPSIPRGQRCSRDRRWVSGRRLPPLPAARPYHPVVHHVVPGSRSRGIIEGSLAFTRPAFPLPGCSLGRSEGPWAFPSSFAPPAGRTCGRTSRRGPISNTDQELRTRHNRPPICVSTPHARLHVAPQRCW